MSGTAQEITARKVEAMCFGRLVVLAREILELSQEDLGSKVEVASSTISRYERGELLPDIGAYRRLASALGTDIREFESALTRTLHLCSTVSGLIWGHSEGGAWWRSVHAVCGVEGLGALIHFVAFVAMERDLSPEVGPESGSGT